MARYTFSGHESFFCKSLWLKKGYDAVKGGLNFNSPEAVAVLGVGKNMVASIRVWLKAFAVVDDRGVTKFADYIFSDKFGKDPFIEDVGTNWLLHYMLVKTGAASIYHLAFLDFKREKKEFDTDQLLSFLKRKCNVPEQKNAYNENTVKKDIKVLLQNYVSPADTKTIDDFSAILIDLGLLKRTGRDKFIFAETSVSSIDPRIILYTLLDIKQETGNNTLSIDLLQQIALTYGLSIAGLVEIIQGLVSSYPNLLAYTDNSGIKNVQFLRAVDPYTILDCYYNER